MSTTGHGVLAWAGIQYQNWKIRPKVAMLTIRKIFWRRFGVDV